MTVCALSLRVMDIAGIGMPNTIGKGDFPRATQGCEGRGRSIAHPVIRMKGGEMQGDARAQVFHDPRGHGVDLLFGVIETRNQQGRQLQPDPCFIPEIVERVQNGLEPTATEFLVKFFRKSLEIHIGGVHLAEKCLARLAMDIARSYRHGENTALPAGPGRIHGVLHEDYRVVIGVGNAFTVGLFCHARDFDWRRPSHQAIHLASLAHVPILAELAGKIATRRAEREDG